MKKAAILITTALLLLATAFVFSIKYKEIRLEQNIKDLQAYTTTEGKKVSTTHSKKELVAENKEGDYRVYFDGENTYIQHKNIEKKFVSWSWSLSNETPKLYYLDINNDGKKELLMKLLTSVNYEQANADKKRVESFRTYKIVIVREVVNQFGEEDLLFYHCTEKTWQVPFENSIRCDLVQLKNCKKFLQLAMNNKKTPIIYDKETGLTDNKFVGYASALCNTRKQYYTMKDWSKGYASYSVKDGKIYLDIQIIVEYEEIKGTHYIGNINCEVAIINNKVDLVPSTIKFVPLKETRVTDPRDVAKKNWNVVIENTGTATSNDDYNIDWISTSFDLTDLSGSVQKSFDGMLSNIKFVESVEFSESRIVFNAKKGYAFPQRLADKGAYSVVLNPKKANEQEISYLCEVTSDSRGSHLIITFDKTYDQERFDGVEIKFGI